MEKYYELKFDIKVKTSIELKDIYEKISTGINFCLEENKFTKELHNKKGIKHYSYEVFNYNHTIPLKPSQKCTLIIRCFGKSLSDNLIAAVLRRDNNIFFAENLLSIKEYEYNYFDKILAVKTISPAIITKKRESPHEKNGYIYANGIDQENLVSLINNNLINKFIDLTGEQIDTTHLCIEDIKILNKYPLLSNYKNGRILGNKFLIKFKKDELSQKLAFIAKATGICEKNTLGFGCCSANNDYLYDF